MYSRIGQTYNLKNKKAGILRVNGVYNKINQVDWFSKNFGNIIEPFKIDGKVMSMSRTYDICWVINVLMEYWFMKFAASLPE